MIWRGYTQEGLSVNESDIRFYDVKEYPFKLYGLPKNEESFRRLPKNVSDVVTGVKPHCDTSAGIRVRFATDSSYIAIRVKHNNYNFGFPHLSKAAYCGFDIYVEENNKQIYKKTYWPPLDTEDGYEGVYRLGDGLKQITIYFPLATEVYSLEIGVKESSVLSEPREYSIGKPIVFYGSSITQGIAVSRPGNIYEGFISRDMDCDFINLGFAGSCRGETALAEYMSALDMSAFVLDYDHNAPSIEHLKNTHEAFYKIIREAQPQLPIILITRPEDGIEEELQERRTIVMETFVNARNNGDKNIYFIDGHTFFPTENRYDCTADGTHPNDLGMYFMAKKIGDLLKEIIR